MAEQNEALEGVPDAFNEEQRNMVRELRGMWEIAHVRHFCTVFAEDLSEMPSFTALDLELAIVSPNNMLIVDIHCKLMLPLVRTKGDVTPFTWVSVMRDVFRKREGKYPFLEENPMSGDKESYEDLSVNDRVGVLQCLCDWQLDENPKIAERIKGMGPLDLRVMPIGQDAKGNNYWYYNDSRLYREGQIEYHKGEAVPGDWETLCTTKKEWDAIIEKLSESKNKDEKKLCELLRDELLPHITKVISVQEEKMHKTQQAEFIPRKKSSRVQMLELSKQHKEEEDRLRAHEREQQQREQRRRQDEAARRDADNKRREIEREREARLEERAQRIEEARVREEEEEMARMELERAEREERNKQRESRRRRLALRARVMEAYKEHEATCPLEEKWPPPANVIVINREAMTAAYRLQEPEPDPKRKAALEKKFKLVPHTVEFDDFEPLNWVGFVPTEEDEADQGFVDEAPYFASRILEAEQAIEERRRRLEKEDAAEQERIEKELEYERLHPPPPPPVAPAPVARAPTTVKHAPRQAGEERAPKRPRYEGDMYAGGFSPQQYPPPAAALGYGSPFANTSGFAGNPMHAAMAGSPAGAQMDQYGRPTAPGYSPEDWMRMQAMQSQMMQGAGGPVGSPNYYRQQQQQHAQAQQVQAMRAAAQAQAQAQGPVPMHATSTSVAQQAVGSPMAADARYGGFQPASQSPMQQSMQSMPSMQSSVQASMHAAMQAAQQPMQTSSPATEARYPYSPTAAQQAQLQQQRMATAGYGGGDGFPRGPPAHAAGAGMSVGGGAGSPTAAQLQAMRQQPAVQVHTLRTLPASSAPSFAQMTGGGQPTVGSPMGGQMPSPMAAAQQMAVQQQMGGGGGGGAMHAMAHWPQQMPSQPQQMQPHMPMQYSMTPPSQGAPPPASHPGMQQYPGSGWDASGGGGGSS